MEIKFVMISREDAPPLDLVNPKRTDLYTLAAADACSGAAQSVFADGVSESGRGQDRFRESYG